MVTFVIFWAALFCVIFFLLGTFFKVLASLFSGFISSVLPLISMVFLTGCGIVALIAMYLIALGIRDSGLGEVIVAIVIFFIVICIIVGLAGELGVTLINLATLVAEGAIKVISNVLEGAAGICEAACLHFLLIIKNRLDKC